MLSSSTHLFRTKTSESSLTTQKPQNHPWLHHLVLLILSAKICCESDHVQLFSLLKPYSRSPVLVFCSCYNISTNLVVKNNRHFFFTHSYEGLKLVWGCHQGNISATRILGGNPFLASCSFWWWTGNPKPVATSFQSLSSHVATFPFVCIKSPCTSLL